MSSPLKVSEENMQKGALLAHQSKYQTIEEQWKDLDHQVKLGKFIGDPTVQNQVYQRLLHLCRDPESKQNVETTLILRVVKELMNHLTDKQKIFFNKNCVLNLETLLQMQINELCRQQAPSEQRMKILWDTKEKLESRMRAANFLSGRNWDLVVYGSLLNSIVTKDLSDLDITIVVEGYIDQAQALQ